MPPNQIKRSLLDTLIDRVKEDKSDTRQINLGLFILVLGLVSGFILKNLEMNYKVVIFLLISIAFLYRVAIGKASPYARIDFLLTQLFVIKVKTLHQKREELNNQESIFVNQFTKQEINYNKVKSYYSIINPIPKWIDYSYFILYFVSALIFIWVEGNWVWFAGIPIAILVVIYSKYDIPYRRYVRKEKKKTILNI